MPPLFHSMKYEYLPTRFSLGTLLLIVTSFAVALGLGRWAEAFPPGIPIAMAVPLFWVGALLVSIGSNGFRGSGCLVFFGAGIVGIALVSAFLGTFVVTLQWLAGYH